MKHQYWTKNLVSDENQYFLPPLQSWLLNSWTWAKTWYICKEFTFPWWIPGKLRDFILCECVPLHWSWDFSNVCGSVEAQNWLTGLAQDGGLPASDWQQFAKFGFLWKRLCAPVGFGASSSHPSQLHISHWKCFLIEIFGKASTTKLGEIEWHVQQNFEFCIFWDLLC